MCDGDMRKSYKATPSYARHGRVTTRAAGGATELLGMGFSRRALWTSMTRLGYAVGVALFLVALLFSKSW